MTTGPRPGLRVQGKVRGTRDVDLAMGASHFEHFVNAKCLARSAPPALPGFFVGSDCRHRRNELGVFKDLDVSRISSVEIHPALAERIGSSRQERGDLMKQTTFASAAWDRKGKVTRRERFLGEMDQVIPWPEILALNRAALAEGR
jgi:hypothetical protein